MMTGTEVPERGNYYKSRSDWSGYAPVAFSVTVWWNISWLCRVKLIFFLACMYKCTGRAIELPLEAAIASALNTLFFNFGFFFLLGKYLVLEITTTKSHMKLWLNKTYSWHWLCWTKPMPGICFVGQNLCLAYVVLSKTYSWHTLCWTKPIPSIGYVRQNLFLAYVMLDKTTHGTYL